MKNTTLAEFAIKVTVFYFSLAGFCQSIHAQSEIKVRLVHDTVVVVSMVANEPEHLLCGGLSYPFGLLTPIVNGKCAGSD